MVDLTKRNKGILRIANRCVLTDLGRRQQSMDQMLIMVDELGEELGRYIVNLPGVVETTYSTVERQTTVDVKCLVVTPMGFKELVEQIEKGLKLGTEVSLGEF
jgi:hypothetical protein